MEHSRTVDSPRQRVVTEVGPARRHGKVTMRLLRGMLEETALTDEEQTFLQERRRTLEETFYSEAIYALVRKWVSPPQARALWNAIVEHRSRLTSQLGRNPGLAAATADFLENHHTERWEISIVEVNALNFLARDSMRDGLTLLQDRDSFFRAMEREIDRARRYNRRLAVNVIEPDEFVALNVTHGRVFGDFVLRELASILDSSLRSSDVCARFRGEQFTVLLPESNIQRAFLTAERIRRAVERHPFVMREDEPPLSLTVSAGIAEYPIHGRDSDTLIESSESALRLAREGGHNRVCLPPRVVIGADPPGRTFGTPKH